MHTTSEISLLAAGASLLLAGCASGPGPAPADRIASATLEARSGSSVSGVATFTTRGERLFVDVRVTGLTPGEHGFHVHEAGDCGAADASSAKGHFNPGGKRHGHHGDAERHAGDMPNLVADRSGNANLATELFQLSLGNGPGNIAGRSVVIHADPDDYRSQPAGNSGTRVACGVIRGTAPRY